jgi:cytochrome c peroxidase
MRRFDRISAVALTGLLAGACAASEPDDDADVTAAPRTMGVSNRLDRELGEVLARHGLTGEVGASLEPRLGRALDPRLVEIGRLLFFDEIGSLNDDNTCGSCHAPSAAMGDTQSIAIGIDSNRVVGADRAGPRNQRRAPSVINTVFYPALMWNARFSARSGDPFDNRGGLLFPAPEGLSLSDKPHLLTAQAFIPPTERVEAAGFDVPGDSFELRAEVIRRLNTVPAYHDRFAPIFPAAAQPDGITYDMFAAAIAEFEFSLVRADAPIDRFARGETSAMTSAEKRGALLFFGKARCVECHAVSGASNQMFSDFRMHVIAVPQIFPAAGHGNVIFDGPGDDEDFGLEQVTGDPADRYAFRTSPLRNVAAQPTFFHNGAFTRLEQAIVHHLDVRRSVAGFITDALDDDLRNVAPMDAALARLDPILRTPIHLGASELADLVEFVGRGLLDPGARPEALRGLTPTAVPSGHALPRFQ